MGAPFCVASLAMRAPFCVALLVQAAGALNASDIPRFRTVAPGAFPQNGVTGCGNPGLPPTGQLDDCTEPLHPDAPDIRGFWQKDGTVHEYIAMCGPRWIDVSTPVVHDHPNCDGTMEGGVEDYSGPDIVMAEGPDANNNVQCRGLCSAIYTAARFNRDSAGNKCVTLYADPFGFGLMEVVSRCLQQDGSMIWTHPVFGVVHYHKVPEGEEPNCITCPDGSVSMNATQRLACAYQDRNWTRCDPETEGSSAPEPEVVTFCKSTMTSINGPLYVGLAIAVLLLCCGGGCYLYRQRQEQPAAEKESHTELTAQEAS